MGDVGGRVEAVSGRSRAADFFQTIAFGVGHFYNDLCACLWFSFLVIYSEKVLMLSSVHSGFVILIGQITDGVATPLVGYLSDKYEPPGCFKKYGKRKTWHLAGSVLVTCSFPFIFNVIVADYEPVTDWIQLAWLIPFVVCFQIGWATVQISHLALIPHLAPNPSHRTTLNALRNCFTIVAQVTVFALMIWFLGVGRDKLSPDDKASFRKCDWIVVGLGIATSTLFHIGTREPEHSYHSLTSQGATEVSGSSSWRRWMRMPRFWVTAVLYMSTRLYINVSQVYMGLYVEYTQNYDKKFVAVIPLVVCMASFVVSTAISIPGINRLFSNNKLLYMVGGSVGGGGCVWLWTLGLSAPSLYAIAALLGVAQALVLVTSLGITAELIGSASATCAFVYGSMSFADKVLNGVCYQIIQTLDPSCE